MLDRFYMSEIVDSGNRREFKSGAVRDITDGKGRCDLLPLDIVGDMLVYYDCRYANVVRLIDNFIRTGDTSKIEDTIKYFTENIKQTNLPLMFIEVSKHFEDGAKKYSEINWEKGIPTHCYVDSGVRHFLK